MIQKFAGMFVLALAAAILLWLIQKGPVVTSSIHMAGLLQGSGNVKLYDVYKPGVPSIGEIFDRDHSWIATLSARQIRTLIVTGDVIPARSVNIQALQRKDFKWPYLKTAQVLKQADITLINLETPLIDSCQPTNEGMSFCGDLRNVEGLVYAGVDIATLANNHAGNYGSGGVQETIKLLSQNGILAAGVDGSIIKEIRGIKFAFLGYNDVAKSQPGISNVEEEKVKREIKTAKTQVDVVIVTYHWGLEYKDQPDDRQKFLGHLAIDAGADLVIGNHPHWIQPVEIYKGKLITYAHGNFVFDQMWSQRTREGIIGRYTFFDKALVDIEYLPVQINDFGQPDILDQAKGREILDRTKDESIRLSNNL